MPCAATPPECCWPPGTAASRCSTSAPAGRAIAQEPNEAPTPPPPTAPTTGQGTTITLRMPDGTSRTQIVLAVPAIANLASLQGTAGNAARTLEQTLTRDLDKSGIFRIVGAWWIFVALRYWLG